MLLTVRRVVGAAALYPGREELKIVLRMHYSWVLARGIEQASRPLDPDAP